MRKSSMGTNVKENEISPPSQKKSPKCRDVYKRQAHTLMQTIARANRVSEGKSNGLIVDYIGIVKALRKACLLYTST